MTPVYIVRILIGDYGSTFVSSPKKKLCKTTHVLRYPTTEDINKAYEFANFQEALDVANYLSHAVVQVLPKEQTSAEDFIDSWKEELFDRFINIDDDGGDDEEYVEYRAKKELAEEIYNSILDWEKAKNSS